MLMIKEMGTNLELCISGITQKSQNARSDTDARAGGNGGRVVNRRRF